MKAMLSGMAVIIIKEKNLIGSDSHGNHWDGHYKFNNDSTAAFTFNVHYTNGMSILSENTIQKSSHQKFEVILPEDIIEDKIYTSDRSEEHTSELQSLMRISYAVFCLKKKKN